MNLTKALRFRLRSLLLLVTAMSVGFACYASVQRAERLELAAFHRLQARGFTVAHYTEGAYIHAGPAMGMCGTGLIGSYGAQAAPSGFTEQDAEVLKYVRSLRSLNLSGQTASEEALATVRKRHPDCHIAP